MDITFHILRAMLYLTPQELTVNRSIRLYVAVLAVAMSSACKKDDALVKTTSAGETNLSASADSADARGHAFVRVVNAIENNQSIMLNLDDRLLFDSVKSGTVTAYREVSATMAKFSATAAAPTESAMMSERNQMLKDGVRYTIVYIAEDVSKNALRVVNDDVVPDSGKARVRIIHAAPGAPSFDVSVAGAPDKLFKDIEFESEDGFRDVEPGTVTFELRGKDAPNVLLRASKVALKAGTATTIVITGASKLSYFTFTDAALPSPNKP